MLRKLQKTNRLRMRGRLHLFLLVVILLINSSVVDAAVDEEWIRSPVDFSGLKLNAAGEGWDFQFVCFANCDETFNELVLGKALERSVPRNDLEGRSRARYVVVYSGEIDEGDVLVRMDDSYLRSIEETYKVETYVVVDPLLAVKEQLPCSEFRYALDRSGDVVAVIVDFLRYGIPPDATVQQRNGIAEAVSECVRASLLPLEVK